MIFTSIPPRQAKVGHQRLLDGTLPIADNLVSRRCSITNLHFDIVEQAADCSG